MADAQRAINHLNGYHDGVVEAIRIAASQRGHSGNFSGSRNLLDDDNVRKSLTEFGYNASYLRKGSSQDNIHDNDDNHVDDDEDDEDVPPACGTIRIRTLEDIIRQLELHSTKHVSPYGGAEDMRLNNDGDAHYRIDSSVCSESSQGLVITFNQRKEENRFLRSG